ncbi:MAG: winged helix-turn-helix domain-containing protein [Candidatus Hodarchaeota archaeon]
MEDKSQDPNELQAQSPSHKDFITFKPLPVKYIQQAEFEFARKHTLIIRALRSKNMTVSEIDSLLEEEGQPVTKKTIYQNLKRLEEKGLVAVAGRRMTKDGRLTEKLFTATAKVFFLENVEANRECLESEQGKLDAQILNTSMSEVFQVPEADPAVFYDFYCRLREIQGEISVTLRETLRQSEKMTNLITQTSTENFIELLGLFLILGAFFKEPELLKNLQKMLGDTKL